LKTISVFWLTVAVSLATPSDAVPQTRSATQESRSSANQQKPATEQVRIPDVIYVPTPPEVVDKMLRMAGVKEGDVLYDLGSGDGRIVITAAKQYKVRGVGIDIGRRKKMPARPGSRTWSGSATKIFFRRTSAKPR
jgi:Histone methylation protein DOT1